MQKSSRAVTCRGTVAHTYAPATGIALSPTVERHVRELRKKRIADGFNHVLLISKL